jgi:hypothetical protein
LNDPVSRRSGETLEGDRVDLACVKWYQSWILVCIFQAGEAEEKRALWYCVKWYQSGILVCIFQARERGGKKKTELLRTL